MTAQRIPKPGEVWSYDGTPTPVVNVYPDAVTYMWRRDRLVAETLETFVESYTPPEPTVVGSRWIYSTADLGGDFATTPIEIASVSTHRLDLMSDGEFRVVKL